MQALLRGITIVWIVARYRLDTLVPHHALPWRYRLWIALLPWRWLPYQRHSEGVRLREALQRLGPIFVKFGQLLSTRRDLIPTHLADELAKLQDQVPPFCGQQAQRIIEHSLQQPVAQIFAQFDTQPLASASVAQVHAAQLHSGEQVVIKVIRPGIIRTIRKDLLLLRALATVIERLPGGTRFRPKEVVADYHNTVLDELDLLKEAANAELLRANFAQSELLYVPRIYRAFCRSQVMVMERVQGIAVSDIAQMQALGMDLQRLAARGVEIFFTQVFRDSFFHADMHPGNIFVCPQNPDNPRYLGVDFGIMGSLSQADQTYLAHNLLAFFNRDYRRVAELHVESGWVPANTPVHEFERAIRAVCEPIFQKPLSEISFGGFLLSLFQTARRFNMPVQPQLVLLQKTLLNVEGLGRQLYPDLDLWATAKPFLEDWIKQRFGVRQLLKQLRERAPVWIEKAPQLPDIVYSTLVQSRQWHTENTLLHQQLLQVQQSLHQQRHRHHWRWLCATALAILAIVPMASELQIGLGGVAVITLLCSLSKRSF